MKKFYTPNELIKILGLSKNTVYKYLREGSIKTLRIGRGAYRVPVSEVERMLNVVGGDLGVLDDVREGDKTQQQLLSEQAVPPLREDLVGDEQPSSNNYLSNMRRTSGNLHVDSDGSDLFDWMMGIMSAMVGFSFFFPTSYVYRYEFLNLAGQLQILRFFLVGGGFLLIFSDLFWKRDGDARRFVNLLMAGLYGWLTGLLFIAGSYQAAAFYVAVALVFLFTLVKSKLLVVWKYFTLVIVFLLIMAILLFIPELHVGASRWLASKEVGYVLLGVITLIAILESQSVKRGRTSLTFPVLGSIGVVFLWFAYVMVGIEAWDMVAAYVVLGVFSFFLPHWRSYKVSWHGSKRQAVRRALVVISVVVLAVSTFGYINKTLRSDFSEREFRQRSDDVSSYVEDWSMASKKEISAFSESSLLREAIVQGDDELLYKVIRDFIRSSGTLLQVIVLSSGGDTIAYYPRTSSEAGGINLAFRGYFQRALSGEVFVGDLFKVSTDPSLWIVPVSAPVYNSEGIIIGVVGARMNLFVLQDYLGEIEIGDGGRVILADSMGRAIVHPDESKLYQVVDNVIANERIIRNGIITGSYENSDENTTGKSKLLIGYVGATSSQGWVLSIDRPTGDVSEISGLLFLVFLSVLTVSLVMLVWFRERNVDRLSNTNNDF